MKKSSSLFIISLIALLLTACKPSTPKKKKTSSSSGQVSTSVSVDPTSVIPGPTSGEAPTSIVPGPTSSVAPTSSSGTSASPSTSVEPIPPGDYYKECEGLSGTALLNKLYEINQPKNPSYDWERYEDADEAEDDSSSILSLYTRHNIKKSSHCGNYSWDKWNREHIWTQTKWPKSASDNHNIFACEGQINGYRSDKIFKEGGETVVVFGHVTGCKQTSDTFEPCDEAKGEVARSVMYGTVAYQYTMTNEIDSIYLALKWHLEHPITSRDIKRNEVVYRNQGNRNPFVDHPEYGCRIWGSTNAETQALCSK